jgi:hypothetical protein
MAMLRLKKKSAWKYGNSESKGFGISYWTAGWGWIEVIGPNQKTEKFSYLQTGVSSPSLTIKDVDIPVSASKSESFFPGWGAVYTLKSFKGDELTAEDFLGGTLSLNLSIGAGVSFEINAMLIGIPVSQLQNELHSLLGQLGMEIGVSPLGAELLRQNAERTFLNRIVQSAAKGVIFSIGPNSGVVLGASAAGTYGALRKAS